MTDNHCGYLSEEHESNEDVFIDTPTAYFSPELQEIIIIEDDKLAKEFFNSASLLSNKLSDLLDAESKYNSKVDEYARYLAGDNSDFNEVDDIKEIDELETEVKNKRKELFDYEIENNNQESKDGVTSYLNVIELLILPKLKKNKKTKPLESYRKRRSSNDKDDSDESCFDIGLEDEGVKVVYGLRKCYSLDGDSIKNGFRRIAPKSINGKINPAGLFLNNFGVVKVDREKLASFLDLAKEELKKLNIDEDWSKEVLLNLSDTWTSESENIEISYKAQALRFIATNKSSREDLESGLRKKNEIVVNIDNLKAELNTTIHYPNKTGWAWKFHILDEINGKNDFNKIDLGHMRIALNLDINGYLDANFKVDNTFEAETLNEVDALGAKDNNYKTISSLFKGIGFSKRHSGKYISSGDSYLTNDANVSLFLKFVANLDIDVRLQWLKPAEILDNQMEFAYKYIDICQLDAKFKINADVNFEGNNKIQIIDEAVYFFINADLCLASEVQGVFAFKVNWNNIFEFLSWFGYQVYNIEYTNFKILDRRMFGVLCRLGVFILMFGKVRALKLLYSLGVYLLIQPWIYTFKLIAEFVEYVNDNERYNLALNINKGDASYYYFPPEAKGMTLYFLLEQELIKDIFKEYEFFDRYSERKEAILNIIQSIQTLDEWNKIMLRLNENGYRLGIDESEDERSARSKNVNFTGIEIDYIKKSENKIHDFLNKGKDKGWYVKSMKIPLINDAYKNKFKNVDFNQFLHEPLYMNIALSAIRGRLNSSANKNYPLCGNDLFYYISYRGEDRSYFYNCSFDDPKLEAADEAADE